MHLYKRCIKPGKESSVFIRASFPHYSSQLSTLFDDVNRNLLAAILIRYSSSTTSTLQVYIQAKPLVKPTYPRFRSLVFPAFIIKCRIFFAEKSCWDIFKISSCIPIELGWRKMIHVQKDFSSFELARSGTMMIVVAIEHWWCLPGSTW